MGIVKRNYSPSNVYRYGFNGKENDNEVKGEGSQQDYGMRVYDLRLGKFLSVDPLLNSYSYYTPYQFASNMPVAATDLDGLEAKVSFDYATVTKDRTAIEVKSSVTIKIQILNLSKYANKDLDLNNVALNLHSDLYNKLGGSATHSMEIPFQFIAKGNKIVEVRNNTSHKENKIYSIEFDIYVIPEVSVVDDISKVGKDAWVFAIVDKINDQTDNSAGIADVQGGKVALGEGSYFEKAKAYKEGRKLIFHEILHLLGALDSYKPGSLDPQSKQENNAMYYLTPNGGTELTDRQKVLEIWTPTIGGMHKIFTPGYKQPENPNSNTSTQDQLRKYVKEKADATKLDP